MTRTVALVLLVASAAHAEQWCISRTGRLRLRPAGCFETERRAADMPLLAPATGTPASLAVVDKDGELIGYVLTGFGLIDRPVTVLRTIGADSLALPVGRDGLFGPGAEAALYFAAADCTGPGLLPDLGGTAGLLKVGPVWPDRAWYAVGTSQPATVQSFVLPPPTPENAYICSQFNGTVLADDFCCLASGETAADWFGVASFAPAEAGLEPPFRLSVEP